MFTLTKSGVAKNGLQQEVFDELFKEHYQLVYRTAYAGPSFDPTAHEAMQSLIQEALAKFTPRAVEILVLRYVHGYSEVEIARLLGRSRGTVAVTLFRARARLKKILGRYHETPRRKLR